MDEDIRNIGKAGTQALLSKPWKMFPICIPSYKRWQRSANKTLVKIIEECDEEIQRMTYVFVRAEQEEQYRESFPSVNIVVLPTVNGLAGTRQYIQEYVISELHEPYFIDMDDDITGLRFVYYEGGKDRLSSTAESNVSEILRLGCAISTMAFVKDRCVLGNFHRVRFASNYPASQTAYQVNKGSTPRQITFVNAKELVLKGVKRNMAFDISGDDVGFVAEIARKGGDFFQIPCLAYSFVDDAVNSVIRNDTNRRELAEKEYELLKQYPMKNYLRITQKFEDGAYRFSDIDYAKYRETSGRPQTTVGLRQFVEWYKGRQK